MGILNVDNIQPVGGGTTITLNSSEINVGAGITFESNGQAIYAGVTTFASNINLGGDIIHSGDNTKIRFPANDTITFETSGSEKLRITSNGKVGIGTNNPTQLIEVQDRSTGTLCGLNVGTQYGNAHFGGYNNYPAIMNNTAQPLIYCDTNNDRTIFFGDTVGFGTTCSIRIGNAGIATVSAQGLNVTGIVTATSMTVFSSGIDYQWQGGTATAWWKSEDIVSETSWPAAKGGSDANFINGQGGSNGISYIASDSLFNNHKTVSMSSGGSGSLRTSNQDQNRWWNNNDAFTMIMALQKDGHHSGSSLGDSAFAINYTTAGSGSNVGGWGFCPFGDHTWGGQYGEIFAYTGSQFEGQFMMFSYPFRGLFMIRMGANFDYGELSVNGGHGWHPLEMRHSGPSSLPSNNFRSISILNNACENSSSHNFEGRVAECAWYKGKRLGGAELETITRHWCEKFQL